jgi:PAS domain S-box-containing protein
MAQKPKASTLVARLLKENERLKSQLAQFQLVFESIPHLMFVKDSQGQFVWANKAAVDFYGVPSAEYLVGKRDADFNTSEAQLRHFIEDERKIIKTGQAIQIQKEANTDANGKIHWLSTIKVPVKNTDGSVYVVIVATIIDRLVALEQRLGRKRLRAKNHKDMTVLAGQLAHQLGTRIVTLENLVSLLPQSEEVSEIMEATDSLKQFCDDFRRLAVSHRVMPKRTNLIPILRRAVRVPKDSTTKVTLNGDSWPFDEENDPRFDLAADEQRLTDVFAELFSNSIRASNPGPHSISIEVHPNSISLAGTEPCDSHPKSLRIHFRDNGPGIPTKLRPRLFKPFTSSRAEGTGLGLAAVREVIEAHGGSIAEKGETGSGACFEIILPTKLTSSR